MRRPRDDRSLGAPLTEHTPEAAKRAGIGMIFQEMSLVPTLTVAQNIFLNHEMKSSSASSTTERRSAARANCSPTLGVDIDPPARRRRSLARASVS